MALQMGLSIFDNTINTISNINEIRKNLRQPFISKISIF